MNSFSTISELLEYHGIDPTKTGLARHPIRNPDVRYLYEHGFMDSSMSLQNERKFDKYVYVLSFLGFPDETCLFLRGYIITGFHRDSETFMINYPFPDHVRENSVFYTLEPLVVLDAYQQKLLVNWGKGSRAWLQNGTTEKAIIECLDKPLDSQIFLDSVDTR